ncbi:hypothetical protein LNKW23_19590 [Paralimibaculum aggregatum]|uniref:Protein GrpE n=1 Tax=Paralimibaculum aggregatum TaxID=3036245 RepID=A0ABQ6LQ63_9RHOB|nr:nucleotide exchange factor GrpE [Limibaculum sp. NKW23]GMG82746.1 hypothetical protein LNKW23_19590 [Limibaculum sp. NKW23]
MGNDAEKSPDTAAGMRPEDTASGAAGDIAGDAEDTAATPDRKSGLSAEDLVPGLGDAVAAEELAALEARVTELEAERDEMKDRLMRALAEAENVRRRAERDRRDAETYGGTKLARDLLSVHDNLARAVAAADEGLRENHASFLEGVELTQRELLNAFAKHKIQPVEPAKGDKFDPNRHQAMFEAPVPDAQPGTVIEVMQAGFIIADRLLRPALVGVAKAQPKPAAAAPAESAASGEEPPAEGST